MPNSVSIIIYLLLSSALLFAQKEAKKHFAISFSPGIVPLPGGPLGLQPGVEFYFSPKFSLLNEISLQTGKNKDLDSTAINKRYFKYKAEIRFYFAKTKNAVKPYLGLQFSTAKRKFDVNKSDRYYEPSQDDSVYTYNKASINSPVETGTLQLGLSSKVFKDFYFNVEMGYGFRFINTEYSSVVNIQKIKVGFLNIRPISSYRYIGKLTRSQFNLGVSFLYRL